jgi:hypothetical protein
MRQGGVHGVIRAAAGAPEPLASRSYLDVGIGGKIPQLLAMVETDTVE